MKRHYAKVSTDLVLTEKARESARRRYRKRPRKHSHCVVCLDAIGVDRHSLSNTCSTKCDRQKRAEKIQKFKVNNPDKIKEWSKSYASKTREKQNAKNRKYYHLNREACLARNRAWKQKNIDHVKDYSRNYRANNPARYDATSKQEYYLSNIDRIKECKRAYEIKNRERIRSAAKNRRLLMVSAVAAFREIGVLPSALRR
jgi:predicted nucleic acid-binding Zn ribbon protein